MKLELIRENKLKITLGMDELASYGVSPEALSKNSSEAQAMFFSVLRKAEAEVGFAYANSKLVVEAMPLSGDLVIFVTKVGCEAEQRLFDKISSRQGSVRARTEALPKPDAPPKPEVRASYMAELSSFDDVVALCHAVPTYFGGTLYGHGESYYIVVGAGMEKLVAEYGRILDEAAQNLIEEHGTPLIYRRTFDIIRNRFKS